jgi:CheY-like chemotaxis protein
MESGPDTSRPIYSIGAVSQMVGVPVGTLRTWGQRYGVVVPDRSQGGHRLYTRDQLEQLRFVIDKISAGLTPADAHRLLSEHLASRSLPRAEGGTRASTLLILLAESDSYTAELAEYFLRTEGYDVVLATNTDDAVARAEELNPNVVIVDLLISGARGIDLCSQLANRGGNAVLAVSSLELQDQALRAGASAFLSKPIRPLQLVSAVKDLLGRSAFIRKETG